MRISKWALQQYRSIEDCEFKTTDFDVFVGKNNSGKSNVIESFLSYRDIIQDGIPTAQWIQERTTAKTQYSSFTITLSLTLNESERESIIRDFVGESIVGSTPTALASQGWFSEIEHRISVYQSQRLESTIFADIGGELREIYSYTVTDSKQIHEYSYLEFDSSLEASQKKVDLGLSDFEEKEEGSQKVVAESTPENVSHDLFLLPNSLFAALSNYIDKWDSFTAFREARDQQNIQITEELDSKGKNLNRVLTTLKLNHTEKFESISNLFTDIMEGISELKVRLIGDDGDPNATVCLEEDGFDRHFELTHISAGSQELLMLITKIVIASEETELLLIEEPELHLHQGAQEEIFQRLLNAISGNSDLQVIVSTHSKVFMDHINSCQILSVSRNRDTEIESVKGETLRNHLATMGHDMGQILQSSGVIFVEGPSDQLIIEKVAENMELGLKRNSITIYPMGGDDFFDYGGELLDLLKRMRVDYRFIVDSDDDGIKYNQLNNDLGVNPTYITELQEDEVESYLAKCPIAISNLLNSNTEEVVRFLEGENKHKGALKSLWREFDGTSYNEKRHGRLIARHIDEEELPKGIEGCIRWAINEIEEGDNQ